MNTFFKPFVCLLCSFVLFSGSSDALAQAAGTKPNIVFILADDLGYGGVGVYGQNQRAAHGQPALATPNIDALAGAGTRFTGVYASAPICSPTRASLMTGYHSGHEKIDRNGQEGLAAGAATVADVLKGAGYRTGLFGKWGLGGTTSDGTTNNATPSVNDAAALPTNHGFDEVYGYLNQLRAHNYRPDSLWRDDAGAANGVSLTSTNGAYSHDLISSQAEQFIQDSTAQNQPFYLQASFTIPHARMDQVVVPTDIANNPNLTESAKRMAAMMRKLDESVGALVARLDDPNGDNNTSDSVLADTLIVFSSDNGPHQEAGAGGSIANNPNFFDENGQFRGIKRALYDGGVRMPFIVRWDGKVAANAVNNSHLGSFEDFLPTAAELAGTAAPVGIDGVSMLSTLTGQGVVQKRPYLIWEFHEGGGHSPRWAVRRDNWKLIKFADGSFELYDLSTDIDENNNLVSANAALKNELEAFALAEQVEQGNGYRVQFRQWSSAVISGNWSSDSRWSGSGGPGVNWVGEVNNTFGLDRSAQVNANNEVLGFEVKADSGAMTVKINAGATLFARNGARAGDGGVIHLDGGTLKTLRRVELVGSGQLTGEGAVDGDLFNAGLVSAGMSPGEISVTGDYQQSAQGKLFVELAGVDNRNPSDLQYDVLDIDGDAHLDGVLELALLDGYQPVAGDIFTILTADSIHGQFAQFLAPTLPQGLAWGLQYNADNVQATVQLVPEPTTAITLSVGMSLALLVRKTKR